MSEELERKIKELHDQIAELDLENSLQAARNRRLQQELEQAKKGDVRPEVAWFAKRMERKLRLNDHKPHWSKSDVDYLAHRLIQEHNELSIAIHSKEPAENIIDEAADVANFAMMIADSYSSGRT